MRNNKGTRDDNGKQVFTIEGQPGEWVKMDGVVIRGKHAMRKKNGECVHICSEGTIKQV